MLSLTPWEQWDVTFSSIRFLSDISTSYYDGFSYYNFIVECPIEDRAGIFNGLSILRNVIGDECEYMSMLRIFQSDSFFESDSFNVLPFIRSLCRFVGSGIDLPQSPEERAGAFITLSKIPQDRWNEVYPHLIMLLKGVDQDLQMRFLEEIEKIQGDRADFIIRAGEFIKELEKEYEDCTPAFIFAVLNAIPQDRWEDSRSAIGVLFVDLDSEVSEDVLSCVYVVDKSGRFDLITHLKGPASHVEEKVIPYLVDFFITLPEEDRPYFSEVLEGLFKEIIIEEDHQKEILDVMNEIPSEEQFEVLLILERLLDHMCGSEQDDILNFFTVRCPEDKYVEVIRRAGPFISDETTGESRVRILEETLESIDREVREVRTDNENVMHSDMQEQAGQDVGMLVEKTESFPREKPLEDVFNEIKTFVDECIKNDRENNRSDRNEFLRSRGDMTEYGHLLNVFNNSERLKSEVYEGHCISELLQRGWHAVTTFPIEEKDRFLAMLSFSLNVALFSEDDGHIVCNVGTSSRIVAALRGHVLCDEGSEEVVITPTMFISGACYKLKGDFWDSREEIKEDTEELPEHIKRELQEKKGGILKDFEEEAKKLFGEDNPDILRVMTAITIYLDEDLLGLDDA
jgi:hypothetical protein